WYVSVTDFDRTSSGPVWSFKTVTRKASNPSPADGETDVVLDADLSWSAGLDAISHDVYFGTDAGNLILVSAEQAMLSYDPGALQQDMTYYWAVDEHDSGVGVTTGDLWSFTTLTMKATNPSPADIAINVGVNADLSWIAGADAVSHDVYFGTNPASLPLVSPTQAEITYDPGTLLQDTTYYWAIDEHDSGGVTAGDLWSFTTTPPSLPYFEDFESGFTLGQTVGSHSDWFDGGAGPVVTGGSGVEGSVGLVPSGTIFTWTAHPFVWTEVNKVIIGMDFQTDGSGYLDDDRIGWMISGTSTGSSDIFGVQLDPGGSGYNIEGYWDGSTTDRRPSIADLPALSANAWYRLTAEFTRLTDTSAGINVELWSLDASGNPIALVADGSIADTSTLGADAPHSKYFTATNLWPGYKNHTAVAGAVDNAYFEEVPVGIAPPVISNVQTSNITDVSASITWTTDKPSDSVVRYGETTSLGSEFSDATLVTSHSLAITGLSPDTLYYYEVESMDADAGTTVDNNSGAYYSFRTVVVDSEDPIITNPTGDTTGSTGDSVAIQVTITDNVDVTSATLHYTPVGGSETTAPMIEGANDLWSVSVPAGSTVGEIHYYITAEDAVSNTATDPTTGSYIITVSVPGPTTLFSDGFESGNLTTGGWTDSGSVIVKEPVAYEGVYGVQIGGTSWIEKSVSTVGFSTIHVKYARKTKGIDSGESLTVEWSVDGTVWNVIESTLDTAWAQRDIYLGAGAGENAVFSVRFRTNANKTNEYGSVDSVEISGTPSGPVSQPPVACNDAYSVDEDGTLVIAAPGVLVNDSDPEGYPLTAVQVGGAGNGLLGLNPDGSFSYTPNANFNGSDSFTYMANDGVVNSDTATVTITVNSVNDAPVANDDSTTTSEDTEVIVDVLANDTDADIGDTLSVQSATNGSNGTVVNNSDSVTYTPNANFNGIDVFTYTVSDGNGGTDTATVTVTVNPATLSVYVDAMDVTVVPDRRKYYATATVTLAPQFAEATVVGNWYFKGVIRITGQTATTNAGGAATFTSGTSPGKSGDIFEFVVTNVTATGYTYDEASNVVTGASDTI
ncbi:MAG: tandem-95 repeat protein, partial [Planctomycetes bacterium]|nr:tandem-95 repeat protein [Planctomycetota bacterium]